MRHKMLNDLKVSEKMNQEDLKNLTIAVQKLEKTAFIIKATNLIGKPIEGLIKRLPDHFRVSINDIVQAALFKTLDLAVKMSVNRKTGHFSTHRNFNKLMAGVSGATGGAFGMAALAAELPVSTGIMLKSIVDIAQKYGENTNDVAVRLECLNVFAYGGPGKQDDASESAYFAMRIGMAKIVAEAAEFLASRKIADHSAPAVVKLIASIAARFNVVISEKAALQAVPLVGAVTGASLNLLFIEHFQKIAEGHFTVRALERKYGMEVVKSEYERILKELNEQN